MSSIPLHEMPGGAPPPRAPRGAPPGAPRQTTWPGFLAALLMHGALVGWLWFAMQWHTSAVAPAVAVLWDLSAPVDTVPPPQPAPQPVNETPPPPPPQPVAQPKPDIAEKVEKPRKPDKPAQPRKEEPPPKKPVKPAPSPKPPSAQELRRQQQLAERQHDEEMARLTSQVGTPGRTAVLSSPGRLSNAYEARVQAAVRSNIHFAPPEGVEDSVYAEFAIRLIPATGELDGEPVLVHPSGLPGWDEAARRAILHTDPFPLQDDGTAPRAFHLTVRPNLAR